ncbi:MAG: HYR domain-containing protein, partial [Bacteroidota bacterium]
MYGQCTAGAVATHPSDVDECPGTASTTFTAAGHVDADSIRWFCSDDNGVTWDIITDDLTNYSGSGTGTLTINPLLGAFSGNLYRLASYDCNPIDSTNSTAALLTVADGDNPSITCPANRSENLDGSCMYTFGDETMSAGFQVMDNCTATPSITVTQFPADMTTQTGPQAVTVTLTADDTNGNIANCMFTVTLVDVTNPSITCPANITQNVDATMCSAVVTYTAPVGTDACTGPTTALTAGLGSGGTFPVGVTSEEYTVTDGAGLQAVCDFTVTVVDNENPSITCPANVTQNVDAGQCDAVVTYTAPTGTDNCMGQSTALTSAGSTASGSTFPVGMTTVEYTVTDGAGLTDICTFTVTVNDDEDPAITCPGNMTVNNDAMVCSAVVTYTAPSGTDNCAGQSTALTSAAGTASGSTFAVGMTTVEYTVTDAAGNTALCTFTITVEDNEAPNVIGCPANRTEYLDADCEFSMADYTSSVATDNCMTVNYTQSPASGATLTGHNMMHSVDIVASDPAGNTAATCTFVITTVDTISPTFIACSATPSVTMDGSCMATLGDYTSMISASDVCGTVTITQITTGTVSGQGPTSVVMTADDGNGNSRSCAISVTHDDSVDPVMTCPGNQFQFLDATCSMVLNDYTTAGTESDNCGAPTVTQSPLAGVTLTGTAATRVTLTATDGAMNTDTCIFNVFRVDQTDPTIVCPAAQDVVLDGSCNGIVANFTGMGTVTEACDASPMVTQSPLAGATVTGVGPETITLTVTDSSSNTGTCQFTLNKLDQTAPTITVCPAQD